MKHLFLLTLSLYSISASSQMDPVRDFNKHVVENWTGEFVRVSQYQVKGSPFFLGEHFAGTIKYKGGRLVNDMILFNLYTQKAGPDLKGDIFEATEPIEQFTLLLSPAYGGANLHFKSHSFYQGSTAGFYNVLAEGEKISFLKHFKTKLSPDPTNKMAKEQKVFEQFFEYYLYNHTDSSMHKVKLKEKDILRLLDNDKRVVEYIKLQNLDMYEESDITRCINFYNSLFTRPGEK